MTWTPNLGERVRLDTGRTGSVVGHGYFRRDGRHVQCYLVQLDEPGYLDPKTYVSILPVHPSNLAPLIPGGAGAAYPLGGPRP